jgi:hypothetical protein
MLNVWTVGSGRTRLLRSVRLPNWPGDDRPGPAARLVGRLSLAAQGFTNIEPLGELVSRVMGFQRQVPKTKKRSLQAVGRDLAFPGLTMPGTPV